MIIPDWLQADLSDQWPVKLPHAAEHAVEVTLDKLAERIEALPPGLRMGDVRRKDVIGLIRGDGP